MRNLYKNHIKRILDITFSGAAIVVLSPVMGVTAILIKKKLGSPVFFKQERIGKNNEVFTMYKFKTMLDPIDANGRKLTDQERLILLEKTKGKSESIISDKNRLTPFGAKLRSYSIDELPELFNIIKGEMSIVGPRPLPVIYSRYYTTEENKRHQVRPGLTGLAQVNGRNSISWTEKFKFDVEYVNNISLLLDLKIILKTITVILDKSDVGQGEEKPIAFSVMRQHEWDLEKSIN